MLDFLDLEATDSAPADAAVNHDAVLADAYWSRRKSGK